MNCRGHSGQILCDLGVFLNRPVSMGRLRDGSLSFVNACPLCIDFMLR